MPPDDIHCSARPLLRMIVGNTCVQCDNIKGRMIRSPTQSHSARKMGVKMWTKAVTPREYIHRKTKRKRATFTFQMPPHFSPFTNLIDTYILYNWTYALVKKKENQED